MAKWEEVADGSFWELANLSQYEPYFEEGSRGLLELDLRLPVSADMARELENQLIEAGVAGVKVRTASPLLKIYFTKGFPWLAVIAAIILGLIALAILIVGWRLFRDIGVPVTSLLIIAGGIGVLVLAGMARVKRKPT